MSKLTHLDAEGRAAMVDVGAKAPTERVAVARGRVAMRSETLALILEGAAAKGDVLAVARIAGIMAAKRTSDLIPLCHQVPLAKVSVSFEASDDGVGLDVEAVAKTIGRTGVEMEALTAVSVASLTIYDMVKAVDREMRIEAIRLTRKEGGRSGVFEAE